MLAYQLLTILLILSLPFFPKQFADDRIRNLIIFFSISLLPIFVPALLNDIKRKLSTNLKYEIHLNKGAPYGSASDP